MAVVYVPAEGAPPALNCSAANAAIIAPQPGAPLSGVVQIEGTAALGNTFQYYKLEFAIAGRNDFTVFSGLVRQPVVNGQLAVWDSASVPDGVYAIRLRVVDTTGNYCEALVSGLQVQNSVPVQPTEAPTPTVAETEAPPVGNVVPSAIPTIQLGLPTEPGAGATITPRASPPASRTPSATGSSSGLNLSGFFDAVGEIFNGLVRTLLFGAMAMAGVLLVIGVIFYVRRVL
jgi:hypothetical protein